MNRESSLLEKDVAYGAGIEDQLLPVYLVLFFNFTFDSYNYLKTTFAKDSP